MSPTDWSFALSALSILLAIISIFLSLTRPRTPNFVTCADCGTQTTMEDGFLIDCAWICPDCQAKCSYEDELEHDYAEHTNPYGG